MSLFQLKFLFGLEGVPGNPPSPHVEPRKLPFIRCLRPKKLTGTTAPLVVRPAITAACRRGNQA